MGRPVQSPQDSQFLTVTDERTGEKFRIPIVDNAIDASAFKKMKAKRAPGEREENEVGKPHTTSCCLSLTAHLPIYKDRRWIESRRHRLREHRCH